MSVCFENAGAESFSATLKKSASTAIASEADDAIDDYIDGFYNPVRRHSAIDYLSPDNYESGLQLAA